MHWIAASLTLLAMTGMNSLFSLVLSYKERTITTAVSVSTNDAPPSDEVAKERIFYRLLDITHSYSII